MEENVGRESSTSVTTASSHNSNPLSRKLKKILNTRLDNDKDMLDALRSVSTFFTENNIHTRRNLRGEIERRNLLINQQFVDEFSLVMKDLEKIHNDVQEMGNCCKDMTDRLSATKGQTQELITATSKLQKEGQKLQLQSEIADAFLDKFQLKPEEAKIFRGAREGELHPDFFKVLEKVQRIHVEVKVLLRTNHQTAGLEIMEQMALQQEAAFERLYRWSQSQCRALTTESIDVPPLLQQAMKALQNRPVLFTYCLDEFATARRGTVVKGFIDALTRGKPLSGSMQNLSITSNNSRPIELHAHDPLRYISDIFAWLHQSTASEKENLCQMLAECEKTSSIDETISTTLGRIQEGVTRPLKVRVEQVLIAEPGVLVLYKLTNLLKFYHQTISEIAECESNPLLDTLWDMHLLSNKLFLNGLQLLSSKMLDKVELPPNDLSPPRALNETLKLMKDIFETQDMLQASERHDNLIQVMSKLVDPLLQMCLMSASQLQTADMAAYMINCIHSIKFMLSLYEFTDKRIEMLTAQIEAHTDTLVNEQAAAILTSGGLASVYKNVLRHEHDTSPLVRKEGLDRSTVITAFQRFDAIILSPNETVLSQVSLLASATLKEVATARAREIVAEAYTTIYNAFNNPSNMYEAHTYAAKPPDQIRLLLC